MNRWYLKSVMLSLFLCSVPAKADYRVIFSPSSERQEEIVNLLDSAVNTLDIVIYGLSDSVIQKKIMEKASAGVVVRMLVHNADKNPKLSDELESAGIDVRYTSRTNHHKFVIVDGPQSENKMTQLEEANLGIVATGSGNFSRSASTVFDEDLLIADQEREVILAYQHQFNWLWTHSNDYEGGATPLPASGEISWPDNAPVAFTSENVREVRETDSGWKFYSKLKKDQTGAVAAKIIAEIDAIPSGGSLQAAQNHFIRRDIYEAIVRAYDRKVKVSLVLDGGEFQYLPKKKNSSELLDEALAQLAGVDVRYKASAFREVRGTKQMHAKYTILNGKKVITGSYNWSDTSERLNWENIIVIDEKTTVKSYLANFRAIQGYGSKKDYKDLLKATKSKTASCLFPTPLSLTASEMQALKKAAGSWDPCTPKH